MEAVLGESEEEEVEEGVSREVHIRTGEKVRTWWLLSAQLCIDRSFLWELLFKSVYYSDIDIDTAAVYI